MVVSDLPRTLETAEIVARDTHVELWPELMDGAAAGSTRSRRRRLETAFVGALQVRDEAQALPRRRVARRGARPRPPRARAATPRDWHTALAVLHGGVNRIVISYALSGDRTYSGTFEQAPACINVLDLGDDGWIVRTVNYVPYDPLHPARTTTMEHLWEQLRPFLDERA